MNKELFLAIIRNDVKKIHELLNQQKEASADSKVSQEFIEGEYQLDFKLTQEIIAEIEKYSPVDALGAKTKSKLIETLRQPTSTRTKIEFIEDMPHEIQETVNMLNITPLMLASLLGRLDIINLLIAAGANVNSKTSHLGWNNAYCACQYATVTQDMKPLRLLAENKTNLNTLLFDIDAPTERPDQFMPLGYNYQRAYREIVKQPVKIKRDYKSVLHLAMEDLNIPLIETLLELKANLGNLTTLWCSPMMSVFMGPEARKISKLTFVPNYGPNRGQYTCGDVTATVPRRPLVKEVSAGDTKTPKEKSESADQEIQKKIADIVTILIRHNVIIDNWNTKGLACPYTCESDSFRNLTEFSLGIDHFPAAKKILVAAFQLREIARGRVAASTSTIIQLLQSGASLFQKVQDGNSVLQVACQRQNLRAIRQFNTVIKKYYKSSDWPSIKAMIPHQYLPSEHQNLVHDMVTCDGLPKVYDREIFIAILNKDAKKLAKILEQTPQLANQRYQSYLNLEQEIVAAIERLDTIDEMAEKLKKELMDTFKNATDRFVEDVGTQQKLAQMEAHTTEFSSQKHVYDPEQFLVDECGHKKKFASSVDITPVALAALLGDMETLDVLRKYNAKLDLQCNRSCTWTPLAFAYYHAYLTGSNDVITYITQEVDAQGKTLREKEETNMHACGSQQVIQRVPEPKFINVYAIKNSENDYEPLLNHAVRNLNFRLVKLLAGMGATLDAESYFEITPIMTLFRPKPQRKSEPLHTEKDAAALCFTEPPEIKKQKEIALFLINSGVNLSKEERRHRFDSSVEGPKEIMIALQKLFMFAKNKEASILPDFLIKTCMRTLEFSFPTKDATMDTAMHIACREGNTNAVRTFLMILAKHNVDFKSFVFNTRNSTNQTPFECATLECKKNILFYVSAEERVKYEAMLKAAEEDELQQKLKKIMAGDEKSQSTRFSHDEYVYEDYSDYERYYGGADRKVSAEKEPEMLLGEYGIHEALCNVPLDCYSPTPCWEDDLIALFRHGVKTYNVNLIKAVLTLGMNPKTNFSKISDVLEPFVRPVVRHLLGRNPQAPTGDLTKQEEIVRLVMKFWKKRDLFCDTSWHEHLLRTIKNGKDISILVSIFPSIKEDFDPIFKAHSAIDKFVYDAHPYLSTGTLNHLFKILEFRFLQLNKNNSTPFHEACALGKLSVIKSFMRSFVYTEQTKHPLWSQTYVVGDGYNYYNLSRGNYTPFDLALSKFEPKISSPDVLDSADAKAKSETELSHDDSEKLTDSSALKALFMDYLQTYWINPFIATQIRNLYQKLQHPEMPTDDLNELVRNELRRIMISSNYWDYLGLTQTESGKKLLAAAFEKAIVSAPTPKELKESEAVTNALIAQELPDSLRCLAEDCDVDSKLIRYSDKGITLSMERVMQNETLTMKISALQEKLKQSFKKEDPATQDDSTKTHATAQMSKGDSKSDKEQETLASRTLTFIKDKLQTRLDVAMASGQREIHMHPVYSDVYSNYDRDYCRQITPARDASFDDFIIHELREELERFQP